MKLSYLLAAVGMAFGLSVQAADLKDLRIGTDATYEPFEYKSPEGKLVGFEIDLANALCAEMKRKCVFVESPWDGIVPSLLAKKYDMITSGMTVTDQRKKPVAFSDKITDIPYRVIVKRGSGLDGSPASLKGKKIGVLKGSTQEKYANGELKKVGVIVVPYEAQDQVYLDIKSGRLDGTVADVIEVTGGFLSKPEGKDYGVVGPELYIPKYFGTGAGFALRKGETALKAELNAAIKAIRANGTYKKINDKYFKIDVYGK